MNTKTLPESTSFAASALLLVIAIGCAALFWAWLLGTSVDGNFEIDNAIIELKGG